MCVCVCGRGGLLRGQDDIVRGISYNSVCHFIVPHSSASLTRIADDLPAVTGMKRRFVLPAVTGMKRRFVLPAVTGMELELTGIDVCSAQ